MGEHFFENLRRRTTGKRNPSLTSGAIDAREWLKHRTHLATREITEAVGSKTPIILVDDNTIEQNALAGLPVVRFFEEESGYGSRPADDSAAIAELERMRSSGAEYVAFVWHAFWWLKYYPGLHTYLRDRYSCVLDNSRAIVFDVSRTRVR